MTLKLAITLVALSVAVPAFAQKPPVPQPATPVTKSETATDIDPNQPILTELQATKLDDYETHIAAIVNSAQSALAPWNAKKDAVIKEVQAANPGFMWHEASRQGEQSGWVKIPPAPVPPAAPATPPAPTK